MRYLTDTVALVRYLRQPSQLGKQDPAKFCRKPLLGNTQSLFRLSI